MKPPVYAIGDIHGQLGELDRVLNLIARDGGPDAHIVFLGDYTDRGPDSRGVLDRLIEGRDQARPWTFIMGNHDRMFLRFIAEGVEHDENVKSRLSWINHRLGGSQTLASYGLRAERPPMFLHPANGGWETLSSYGLEDVELDGMEIKQRARDAVPEAHRQFLADLALWHTVDELLFVHAGIRPGIPLERQREDDLLWIRGGFLEDDRDHGFLVVHGHTALEEPVHFGNRVDLDSGAGYGRPLTGAVFEGTKAWVLTEEGRKPLEPTL